MSDRSESSPRFLAGLAFRGLGFEWRQCRFRSPTTRTRRVRESPPGEEDFSCANRPTASSTSSPRRRSPRATPAGRTPAHVDRPGRVVLVRQPGLADDPRQAPRHQQGGRLAGRPDLAADGRPARLRIVDGEGSAWVEAKILGVEPATATRIGSASSSTSPAPLLPGPGRHRARRTLRATDERPGLGRLDAGGLSFARRGLASSGTRPCSGRATETTTQIGKPPCDGPSRPRRSWPSQPARAKLVASTPFLRFVRRPAACLRRSATVGARAR